MIEKYFKKPKVEKVHHTQDVQKISDPVESFRNEFDTMIPDYEIGNSFEDVGYEPTEEEEYIFKNDPELQIPKSEYVTVNDDLSGYVGEGLSTDFMESLDGKSQIDFRNEVKNLENFQNTHLTHQDYFSDNYKQEVPFEDRDILSEILNKAKIEKEQIHNEILKEKINNNIIERRDLLKRKNNIESAPMYGKTDFRFIKKASFAYEAHQAFNRARNELEKLSYPTFSDEHLLNVEQIIEQSNKFEAYQKAPTVETYAPNQLSLMKYCHRYVEANNKLALATEQVKKTKLIGFYKNEIGEMVEGELPMAEIEKLASEYYDLRDNNFPEFVKCQVHAGIWKLKDFNWKKERYQDTDQWSSIHKENGEKPGEKITRKYITFDEPLPVENLKGFAYTEKVIKKSKKSPNFEAVEIKVHTPKTIKKTPSVHHQVV